MGMITIFYINSCLLTYLFDRLTCFHLLTMCCFQTNLLSIVNPRYLTPLFRGIWITFIGTYFWCGSFSLYESYIATFIIFKLLSLILTRHFPNRLWRTLRWCNWFTFAVSGLLLTEVIAILSSNVAGVVFRKVRWSDVNYT